MTLVVFANQLSTWFPDSFGGLAPLGRIAWPWYVLIGTSITVLVGMLSSFTHPRPTVAPVMAATERAA